MTFLKRTAVAGLVLTLFTGVGYGMDSFVEGLTNRVAKTINGAASSLAESLDPMALPSPKVNHRHNKADDATSFTKSIEDVFKGLAREVSGPVSLWAYDEMPVMSAAIRVAGVVGSMEKEVLEERKQKAKEENEHREREEREHREREEKIAREYKERAERIEKEEKEHRARALNDARQKDVVQSPLFYGAFRLIYNAGSMAYNVTRGAVGVTTYCIYGAWYLLWGDSSKGA